jgi:hypothetical protein
MLLPKLSRPRHAWLCCASLLVFPAAHAATKWHDPTPEELSMTSQPEVPGASAVILSREETVDDEDGTWTYSFRIKILNQAGRDKYSNISIVYPRQAGDISYAITRIAARTIHADGAIVPFTGKPFDHMVARSSEETSRQKVLALPDVQVGSILEYRYSIQISSVMYGYGIITRTFVPTFYSQTELFARKVSFFWHSDQGHIGFTSSLPSAGSEVKTKQSELFWDYSINLENVMPVADEPYMPPTSSLAQKIVFYPHLSDSIHNADDFWNETGKGWSKDIDDFIGRTSKLDDAVATITAGASTPEEKLRKLYAAVQQMRNTHFFRELSAKEEKVTGISQPKSALDILNQKRGGDLQLTILFVGLARAAGFKAYIMAVTNRDISRFQPQLLTLQQLDDDIAIVELNGNEIALDPAEPLCPFGQLLWSHSHAGGLRQTATGIALITSPMGNFKDSETRRVADLTIDRSGNESGSVDLGFVGVRALRYRQNTLLDDETSLHQDLEDYLRSHMPKGTDVTLKSIDNLHDEEKPLLVHFHVSGPLGNFTGKSSFVPAQLFQVNETAVFPDPKRALPIEFSYPEMMHDAVRLQYPPTWQLEAAPTDETDSIPGLIGYDSRAKIAPNAIVLRRSYLLNADSLAPARYPELRNYDDKVTTKDHEMILFHIQPTPTPTPAPLTLPRPTLALPPLSHSPTTSN